MPRTAPRVDSNHAEIVAAFRRLGWRVLSLAALGAGVPDLLIAKRGRSVLVEVKQPGRELNHTQRRWHASWPGPVYVARTWQDVVSIDEAETIIRRADHIAGP